MKNHVKIWFITIVMTCFVGVVSAQTDSPLAYLEKSFPQLTEKFSEELSSYPAHYIFAVDVSGTMRKYEKVVAQALTPFFNALPSNDRVDVIPFGMDAKTSVLGYSGVVDDGVKKTLCQNIQTLYSNSSYSQEFRRYTDIKNAVDGVAKVVLNNKDGYKVRVVVILTDFRNDERGHGERKLTNEAVETMQSSIKAAIGDDYTRFIALELPVNKNARGYCLDQLRDNVFSFDGHSLEIASIGNDQNVIRQWFEQLRRDIMVTKLKAIVHDANKNSPVELKVEKNIDGKVSAKIKWVPSKLYPTIQVDSTYMSGDEFYFHNNKENFTQTSTTPIEVELGQIKHNSWGFHQLDNDINLGLMFPVPYDKELAQLEAKKPLPSTTISEKGLVFTFFMPFWLVTTIIVLIILYIIGVIKSIARNNNLCFKANVTFYDKYGTQIGDMVRIPKQSSSARMVFGKGGSPRCKIDDAAWQFVVEKKKANPLLVFTKPYFVWKKTSGHVAAAKRQSGKLTDAMRVSCGSSVSDVTHSVRIKLTK